MNDVPLPDLWTGWRSAAALMAFCGHRGGVPLSPVQRGLICWELEKFGPCYCEPPAETVIADALRFSAQQFTPDDDRDPRPFCRFHASLVLACRGREALNLTLAACARVDAQRGRGAHAETQRLLHDAWVNATGRTSFRQNGCDRHLGADEAQDYADFGVVPPLPDAAESAACLATAIAILTPPPGWTGAHALAFLIYASHVTDRPAPAPLPKCAQDILGRLAPMFDHTGTTDELLLGAQALYQRCQQRRFAVLRAVEDQLMHFVSLELPERELVLQIVNLIASADLTAYRRALVTAAMTVLATSQRALQRSRTCSGWPPRA